MSAVIYFSYIYIYLRSVSSIQCRLGLSWCPVFSMSPSRTASAKSRRFPVQHEKRSFNILTLAINYLSVSSFSNEIASGFLHRKPRFCICLFI